MSMLVFDLVKDYPKYSVSNDKSNHVIVTADIHIIITFCLTTWFILLSFSRFFAPYKKIRNEYRLL